MLILSNNGLHFRVQKMLQKYFCLLLANIKKNTYLCIVNNKLLNLGDMKYNIYHKSPVFGYILIGENVEETEAKRLAAKRKVYLQEVKQ